jgi:hypothetical protein
MPCDSVSIAVVQLSEQGSWLLEQMNARDELREPIMLAIAEEIRRALPESEGWTVTPTNTPPLMELVSALFRDAATVRMGGRRPDFRYARGYTSGEFRDRVAESVGAALDRVAVDLLAELTKAEMEQSGFLITSDQVRAEDGVRVIDWEYEVAT